MIRFIFALFLFVGLMTSAEARPVYENQIDLTWLGLYLGFADGVQGQQTIDAIKEYQKGLNEDPTGVLTDEQENQLAQLGDEVEATLGWKSYLLENAPLTISYPANIITNIENRESGTLFSIDNSAIFLIANAGESSPGLLTRMFNTFMKLGEVEYKFKTDAFVVVTGILRETETGRKQKYYAYSMVKDDKFITAVLAWDVTFEEGGLLAINIANSAILNFSTVEAQSVIKKVEPNLTTVLTPAELFKKVEKTVWTLTARKIKFNKPTDTGMSLGTAVAIAPNRLYTNCHVIHDGVFLTIQRHDDTFIPVEVIKADEEHDMCILASEIDVPEYAAIRTYDNLIVGERVFAIGSPYGLELSLTDGLISSKRIREGRNMIQSSAPLSPGNSGGGLFDEYGNLIGITTLRAKENAALTFAIPASEFE